MCEGIVLFNNLFEILSNIDLSSNDSLGNVGDVSATISALFTLAQNAETLAPWGEDAVLTLKTMTSQSACEAYSTVVETTPTIINGGSDIQRYYVLLFETNL